MIAVLDAIGRVGSAVIAAVSRIGYATRFLFAILRHSGTSFMRPRLVIREVYQAGVLSLIIVCMSGLFVGMVLALQGYETLSRYGASESMGVLVAMALVKPFGVRTLWVDSIANSEVLSGSGRHAGKVAGQVVTQWPQLAEPGVDHWGSVL